MFSKAANYRPDIDGLRAIAVLAVLLFHAKIEFMSGGYVGVDVFFVISGYLITSILYREIKNQQFSVLGFYERRFRRLLPALIVVVLFTSIVGVVILHPRDLLDLGQSVFATSLFSSNILFNFESGYFDGPAEFKPLLHTWSLGVEEQYYIFFPLFLILVNRYFKSKLRVAISILFIASFILCVWGTRVNPTSAFYLLPSRAWELLAGSLIAVRVIPSLHSRFIRELLALMGLAFITVSIFYFSKETIFPGYTAALPVAGSALLLYSGETPAGQKPTLVAGLLSNRIMVFIGLISYSLYLWHWPILVYVGFLTIEEPSSLQMLGSMLAIFLCATLSWKYVELPFRYKSVLKSPKALLTTSVVASLLMAMVGAFAILGNGLPKRYDYASDDYVVDSKQWKKWGACQSNMTNRLAGDGEPCEIGASTDNPTFMFWGDSHARSLAPAIELSGVEKGVTGLIATRGACPPLLGIERPGRLSCSKFNNQVLSYLAQAKHIETVVLAGRWTLHTSGERYKHELGSNVRLHDLRDGGAGVLTNGQLVEVGLIRTIEELRKIGKSIIVVNQVPEIGYDVPSIDFQSKIFGYSADEKVAPLKSDYLIRNREVIDLLTKLSNQYDISVVEPADYLCMDSVCRVTINNKALYLDDNHLSVTGSRYLSKMFDSAISQVN